MKLSCLTAILLFSCSSGQSQTVELTGRVMNGVTGEPLARALVEVRAYGQRVEGDAEGDAPVPRVPPVFTDASGVFRFAGLPPGNFQISVSKPEFLSKIEMVDSEPGAKSIEIRLARLGGVAGTVTDAGGNPVHEVKVILYQTSIVHGRRRLTQSRNVATTEDGQYALPNLAPGVYLVKAAGPFAPLFFGGSADWRTATPIDMRSGRTVAANFRVVPQPARKIHGKVTGTPLLPNATFQLFDKQENNVPIATPLIETGGAFELSDVIPGSYTIRTTQGQGRSQVFGEAFVTVGAADVDGLEIRLRPGVDVIVKSDCKMKLANEASTPCGRITLYRSDGERVQGTSNIPAGLYDFEAEAATAYVSSVLVGGQPVLPGEKLRIYEGMGPVEIQAGQDGGTIDPKVEMAGGEEIADLQLLAVPLSASYIGPEELRLDSAAFVKHAPGDYAIYALRNADLQDLEYRNPEALRTLIPSATVKVEAVGHHAATIRNLSK